MAERDIATSGLQPCGALNRRDPDVAAAGVEHRIASNCPDDDVTAAGAGVEFTGDVFGNDVAPAGLETRRSADIACGNVAARGGKGDMALSFGRIDVAAAGGNLKAHIFRNIELERGPQATRPAPARRFRIQEDAVSSLFRRNCEALQQLLRAFLRGVGFKMNAVIDLVRILRVNDYTAEFGGGASRTLDVLVVRQSAPEANQRGSDCRNENSSRRSRPQITASCRVYVGLLHQVQSLRT